MKILLFTLALFSFSIINAQEVRWDKIEELDIKKKTQELISPAKVLLLGSFHFSYPGLDSHKTADENKIDILSDEKQQELEQLLEVLREYKPTKIYVESRNQAFHDSLYQEYKNGDWELSRNETYQIGYRLARELNHERVYAVDENGLSDDIYRNLSEEEIATLSTKLNLLDDKMVNSEKGKYLDSLYFEMYDWYDEEERELTILERFLHMAEPNTLAAMHGHYLVSDFNTASNAGPDGLALWWYTRNLRIFNNILKTQPTEEDRILVIFGNGHMPILHHCFEASPQFEIVTLKEMITEESED